MGLWWRIGEVGGGGIWNCCLMGLDWVLGCVAEESGRVGMGGVSYVDGEVGGMR